MAAVNLSCGAADAADVGFVMLDDGLNDNSDEIEIVAHTKQRENNKRNFFCLDDDEDNSNGVHKKAHYSGEHARIVLQDDRIADAVGQALQPIIASLSNISNVVLTSAQRLSATCDRLQFIADSVGDLCTEVTALRELSGRLLSREDRLLQGQEGIVVTMVESVGALSEEIADVRSILKNVTERNDTPPRLPHLQ